MIHFIVNPHARSGQGYRVWKKVEKQLNRKGVEYRAYLTERAGHAVEYAQLLTKGCREAMRIVVVGGDGTMNEVLEGLCFGSALTLGYIPAGTGDDLARSLKISGSPRRCLERILNPTSIRMMDYGVATYGEETVSHRRFLVSAGIGLDASVCHSMVYSKPKVLLNRLRMRRLCYALVGVDQLFKAGPVKGYIMLDSVRRVEFNHIYFVSVQNCSYEGGGFRMAPGADCGDGYLEVCVVSCESRLQALFILARALQGRSRCRGIRTYTCREAQIHTERPMEVHVDGENCLYQTDLEVRCIEKKIRMIV